MNIEYIITVIFFKKSLVFYLYIISAIKGLGEAVQ